MKKNLYFPILLISSVVSSLFTYRPIFNGRLLGDPFDSRLQLILHEHWWRWFNGLAEFRDTEFFYPYKTALGYSDVFFSQGIVYSILRFFKVELSNAWTITTILFLVIGNIGWVFIAKKFLKNFIFQFLLILTSNLSVSFVFYFSLNPNIVGYSFLPWIYLIYNNINCESNLDRKQLKIGFAVIGYLIYALSCWYGAFFVAITLMLKFFIDFTFINRFRLNFIKLSKINLKIIVLLLPLQLFFIWLFYFVYISVANQPYRPAAEMLRNSPRLELLANGANVNGGYLSGSVLKYIYIFLNLDQEYEYTIGIGLSVFIFAILIIFYSIYSKSKLLINNSLSLAIILTYLLFVVIKDFSIHKIFFENVQGFNSIRCPSRYVIIVGFYAIFAIYYIIDKFFSKSQKRSKKFILILISLFILIDQYRTPFKGWEKSQLINTDLMSKKEEIINNCDYFYYDKPGGWWYDQIEAMTFAIQAGVPTINGYSGAFPPEYPTEPFNSVAPPLKIFNWIEKIDKSKRGCFIAGSTSIKKLNQGLTSIDFIGFTEIETNKLDTWQWAVSPNPYIFIINYSGKDLKINFEINPSKCSDLIDFRISEDGKKDLFQGDINSSGKVFDLEINFDNSIVKRIELISKSESCQISNDPRNLFFEVKNFSYN